MDLETLKSKLGDSRGKQFWRSLDELADSEEFKQYLYREFPERASEWLSSMSRREFLKLMGASLALAGISACGPRPAEKIVPYVVQPENVVPGKPLFYATSMPLASSVIGLLVETHEGRPTKIEGNPDHPASLGATDHFAQASILNLYDPDRAKTITYGNNIASWGNFVGQITQVMDGIRNRNGAGLAIMTGMVTSPTLANQIESLLRDIPQARWYVHEPADTHNAIEGARVAFGQALQPVYDFTKADVIVALDSDFLMDLPGSVRYSHDFAQKRRVSGESGDMNRLYAIESTFSVTGAKADHRLPVRPSRIPQIAQAIASRLGLNVEGSLEGEESRWVEAIAADLQAHRGSSLVIVGPYQPPEMHALAYAINQNLGNVGQTIRFIQPTVFLPEQVRTVSDLVNDIRAGNISLLVMLGGNPVYTTPPSLGFADALRQVDLSVYVGLHNDETAVLSDWMIPEAHYLESWSDALAFDGTASIIQPMIDPLYGGKTYHEVIALLAGNGSATPYDLVRQYWQDQPQMRQSFEETWRRSVHDGLVRGTSRDAQQVSLRSGWEQSIASLNQESAQGMELVFRPDPNIYDGRFANNGWLQELPKPLIKLTWDNAALISPNTANQLGIKSEDVLELTLDGRKLEIAALVTPGHPDDTITVYLGYGRTHAGNVGNGYGFNAYTLRSSESQWYASGLQVRKTGGRYLLAITQGHFSIEGRNIMRTATLEEFRRNPHFVEEYEEEHGTPPSFYPDYVYNSYKWGMAIDMNACIGCNACVVACQSENNIAVVGKKNVRNSREMHWLRIDTYYSGDSSNPHTYYQPMMCQHCERAPCEYVCPVAATTHSPEGINEMTYNRCVGTRYCANNCAWKVRRFNFLQYINKNVPSLKLMYNPDVTVRERGVMEKCTFCVQRVNAARINAEIQNRKIGPDEVLTACQAACPTNAIVFGDLNQDSQAARMQKDPRAYKVLGELNTNPRISYLAPLRNPNPQLEQE